MKLYFYQMTCNISCFYIHRQDLKKLVISLSENLKDDEEEKNKKK
jgi:hypothetical protein